MIYCRYIDIEIDRSPSVEAATCYTTQYYNNSRIPPIWSLPSNALDIWQFLPSCVILKHCNMHGYNTVPEKHASARRIPASLPALVSPILCMAFSRAQELLGVNLGRSNPDVGAA